MSGIWDDITSSIESGIENIESLVGKAVDELVSLGVSAFSGIEWFVQYLIQQGQNPVAFIQTVVDRIHSLGADAISVLEEVVGGIRSEGLEGFVKQKLNSVVQPIIDALQSQSSLGKYVGELHQSTVTALQPKVNALFTGATASGLAFQGAAADTFQTQFTAVSKNLTSLSDFHDEQARINQDFITALEGIGVVAAGLVLIDLVILACEAVITIGSGGTAVLVEAPLDAAIVTAEVTLILALIAADAAVWLGRTIALLVATELETMPKADAPVEPAPAPETPPPTPPTPPPFPPWLMKVLAVLGGVALATEPISELSQLQRDKLIDEIIQLTGWSREEVEQLLRDNPDLSVEALLKMVKSGLTRSQIQTLLGRFPVSQLNAIAKWNQSEGLFKDLYTIHDIPGVEKLVERLASPENAQAVGAGYLLQYAAAHKDNIQAIELKDGNGPDILLKDGTIVDTKSYDWKRYPPFLIDKTIQGYNKQIDNTKRDYPGQPIKYVFDSRTGPIPPAVRESLEKQGVQVEPWSPSN